MRKRMPCLRAAKPFGDELKGVAAGTGLAMLLRNYGLVMRPEKSRGQPVAYRVAVAVVRFDLLRARSERSRTKNPKNWPIGWEPDAAPVKIAPSLFEQLNAEIDGYTSGRNAGRDRSAREGAAVYRPRRARGTTRSIWPRSK